VEILNKLFAHMLSFVQQVNRNQANAADRDHDRMVIHDEIVDRHASDKYISAEYSIISDTGISSRFLQALCHLFLFLGRPYIHPWIGIGYDISECSILLLNKALDSPFW
jgi:hypothetical protein